MISLYPSREEIESSTMNLTDGEKAIINKIEAAFINDTERNLEVFVQPNLNGDTPDIIVTEKNSGIWVIEVKDWNLDRYYIKNGLWYKQTDDVEIKSPFTQVDTYKKNFYSEHSQYLAVETLKNRSLYGSIKAGVYFHKATFKSAIDFSKQANTNSNSKQISVYTLGSDVTADNLKMFFRKPKTAINEEAYHYLIRDLKPSEEFRSRVNINYSKQQERLIISQPKRQKIKGVAGSGKSLVLAARAVDALRRTNGNILILTFNITLVNYLKDRISEVKGKFSKRDFTINSYHSFIRHETNNKGIKTDKNSSDKNKVIFYDDVNLFENHKEKTKVYDAIFIDEVQDFKYEWLVMIEKYFLKENGEFVLFGDEKQNLYSRELESKQIKTTIPSAWNKLSESYRLSKKSTDLAEKYQAYFFETRYEIEPLQVMLDFENKPDKLYYFHTENPVSLVSSLMDFVLNENIHTNDLVFLGTRKETMRKIDTELKRLNYSTLSTFLPEEHYDLLKNDWGIVNKREESKVERPFKVHFWMEGGRIKLSTIHSFKGWEANTVFLIIDALDAHSNKSFEELVYTGLTRGKTNLFIINVENEKLHHFFKKNRSLFDHFAESALRIN